jgi:hypothetical protein
MDRLVRIASVSRKSLGLQGLLLQSDARGQALQKLGLPRIPARPDREFKAMNSKLKDISARSDGVREVMRLRDDAERLWSVREYDASREALRKALKLLKLELAYFRC